MRFLKIIATSGRVDGNDFQFRPLFTVISCFVKKLFATYLIVFRKTFAEARPWDLQHPTREMSLFQSPAVAGCFGPVLGQSPRRPWQPLRIQSCSLFNWSFVDQR